MNHHEDYMVLGRDGNTPGAVTSPNEKPATDNVYFSKQNVKKMMKLNNRNIQISNLDINTESIITLPNMLLYFSDSRHLKSGYLHVKIELLKIECRS